MKHIKYYIIALLALPLMAACGEDDYDAPTPTGNPVMSYSAPTTAVWMGGRSSLYLESQLAFQRSECRRNNYPYQGAG